MVRGGAVGVGTLLGRGFDSRLCHWNFSFTFNLSGRTMALGSAQPLTEMITREVKAAGA